MSAPLTPDLCVIGAGSGGLSVAAGAVQMGAQVVLIERGPMGGDCLNFGCVPSKALLAAAAAAQAQRSSQPFGVAAQAPRVDMAAVRAHVAKVIAGIAPSDSVERFTALGVKVIQGSARFVGPREVAVGDTRVVARRFVVATGSSPATPPIPGLDQVPHLSNETLFDNDVLPTRLVIIGAGPIGAEMAQAYARLGAPVTVLDLAGLLGREDPELTRVVADALASEGVELALGVAVARVERAAEGGVRVRYEQDGATREATGSHLLVATGRAANLDGLGLQAAGIAHSRAGVRVDARLRTTNRRVYAIGDVIGRLQFTHVANYHAGVVIRNALFRLPARVDERAIARVTYTDPEIAAVGLDEMEARARHGDGMRVLRWPFADNDRARAERATQGLVKVMTTRRGRVLGAGIVGRHAGELIHAWVLAVGRRMNIKHMAGYVAPYPTLGEAGKRAAGSYFTPALFSARTRRLVRLLARLG